jgi:hypothetical protein
MTKAQSKILKKYYKKIRQCFPAYNKPEKRYLLGIKNSVEEYVEEYDDFTENSLYESIGEPKEIMANYFQEVNSQVLYKSLSYTKNIRIFLFIIACSIFIACSIKIAIDYKSDQDEREQFINREIVTITDKGENQ